MKYYSLDKILSYGSLYNVIYGERSNGKTYSVIHLMLEEYLETGTPSAYIRRLDTELYPTNIQDLCDPHTDYLIKKTNGEWNCFIYKKRRFYLAYYDNDEHQITKVDDHFFLYCCALNLSAKNKGADRGYFKYTLFDEFMTREFYLSNEFVLYTEVLSTLMRDRDGTIHFLVGNTVNKYCPYFNEMGLYKARNQQQDTIDIYTIGETSYTIAVEYCENISADKPVSKYFAFGNTHTNMIFTGDWETASYPHMKTRIEQRDIKYVAFLKFDDDVLSIQLIQRGKQLFLMVTPWTSEPKNDRLTFVTESTGNELEVVNPVACRIKVGRIIYQLIREDRVFFVNNTVGEIFNNWLKFVISKKAYRD